MDTEEIYKSNPSALAGYHYRKTGESSNPYEENTLEHNQYNAAFNRLLRLEDQSY